MKTSSEIIDGINALERTFPVSEWRCADIDLWPTYRMRLYGAAIDRMLLADALPSTANRLRKLAFSAARRLWRVPLASLKDYRANMRMHRNVSSIFLSDGVSFAKLDGRWYDRVVDPVMEALETRGLCGAKLTPLAEVHTPRHKASRFVQPTIDRIKFFATIARPVMHLPSFEAFSEAALDQFGAAPPSGEWLAIQASRLDALARFFSRQMHATQVRCVFVNTYYSLEGQAFVQAARRLGVTSVDLQHGLQGQHHAAYARWSNVPKAGYSTLPDEFWVWSEVEAHAISAWAGEIERHRPRITGNYWLQKWIEEKDHSIVSSLAEARRMQTKGKLHVLACLSWGLADDETSKLLDAAKLTGPDVVWWWRLHPVEAHKIREFSARLRYNGLDDSNVSATTQLPLYATVRVSDVVLAHSSTVIMEAAEMGVPSIVTSDYGAQFFESLISAGTARKATQPKDISVAIRQMTHLPTDRHSVAGLDDRLSEAVESVFGSPATEKPRAGF